MKRLLYVLCLIPLEITPPMDGDITNLLELVEGLEA